MRLSFEIIAFLISVTNFVAGFLLWYSATVKKDYAAKRDFEHLKRHYEQLAANQIEILKEIDHLQDGVNLGILELKNNLTVLLHTGQRDLEPPKK